MRKPSQAKPLQWRSFSPRVGIVRRAAVARVGLAIALGAVASVSCSRNVSDPPPDDELLDHRITPCQNLCDAQLNGCGPYPNEFIKDRDECVRECASADGEISGGWGHQLKTGQDACIPEWKDHANCVINLSCEEQRTYWSDLAYGPPLSERPCYAEWYGMTDCVYHHPCCEEDR